MGKKIDIFETLYFYKILPSGNKAKLTQKMADKDGKHVSNIHIEFFIFYSEKKHNKQQTMPCFKIYVTLKDTFNNFLFIVYKVFSSFFPIPFI